MVEDEGLQSQGHRNDTEDADLPEGEEGADLGINHIPVGVYIMDAGHKGVLSILGSDSGVKAEMLQ